MKSLHDQSYGFYRRQILLTTKDRPADRKDDRYLGDKLIRETEGIVLWCLEGLHRLVRNGFEFSISDRAKKNLEDLMENENCRIREKGRRNLCQFQAALRCLPEMVRGQFGKTQGREYLQEVSE